MNLRFLFLTFISILFSTQIFAQYQVGHQSFSHLDPNRNNRDVWGEVYYPADVAGDDVDLSTGEFPLIVFGHGFGIAWTEYSVWWEELVAEGYIVAFPRTEGSIFFPSHANFGQDLAFLVDAFMAENTNTGSIFYQHMLGNNAIMGHSMGGGCTYLAAGDYGANVKTIVTLAAAGDTNPSAITAAANIDIPVLNIAAGEECVLNSGAEPIDIHNNLGMTPYKAFVEIEGASHCQFGIASGGSLCTTGEFCSGFMNIADQHTEMFLNAVPWLDFYLKEDCNRGVDFTDNLYNNPLLTYLEDPTFPLCCSYPENISVDLGADPNRVNISWDAVPGATEYQVRYRRALTSTWSNLIATTTNRIVQVLVQNKVYDYRVRSKCPDGSWSEMSAIEKFRTVACDAPGNFVTTQLNNNKVKLEWDEFTYADKYQIFFRVEGSSDNWTKLVTYLPGMKSRVLNNLTPGESYEYKVRSWCEVSYGPFSAIGTFTNNTLKEIVSSTISIDKIYPNPVKEEVNINFYSEIESSVQLTIIDLIGRSLIVNEVNGYEGLNSHTINTRELENGYYFIQIKNGDNFSIQKFIKE